MEFGFYFKCNGSYWKVLASLVAQMVKKKEKKKICVQCRRPGFNLWIMSGRLLGEANGFYNILAWRFPWTEEPDGLQSIGLQRDGHD